MGWVDDIWPRLIQQESGGNPFAVSPVGAFGKAQLMPATSRDPGFGIRPFNPGVPGDNERMGKDYLSAMFSRYGDPKKALVAYNWGPGNADKWGGDMNRLPAETRNYVNTIMGGKDMPINVRASAGTNYGMPEGFLDMNAPHMGAIGPQGGGLDLASLLQQQGGGSNLGQLLLALGSGIAAGGAPGGGGWGGGIGKGLALAQQSQQNSQETAMQRQLMALKMAEMGAPELKSVETPLGPQSAWVSPTKGISPADTSALTGGASAPPLSSVQGLADKFVALPSSKVYAQAAPIYGNLVDAEGRDTKAADLNVVTSVAKIFDPDSVVREGESEMVKGTAALPEIVKQAWKSLTEGKGELSPTVRRQLLTEARSRMQQYQKARSADYTRYKKIADAYKIPMDQVADLVGEIPELGAIDPGQGATQTSTAIKGDMGGLPPGVSEQDVQFTMKKRGMTRQQVIERLRNAP